MVLTGSSGLFEDAMGNSFPKRGTYQFIEDKVRYTFFNPNIVRKEYIDRIFKITQDILKALRIVRVARYAQKNNLSQDLPKISTRTLLIWGLNDTITPAHVGHEFARLLPNSTLKFIDKCCHAPMIENPEKFNEILSEFLDTVEK